MAKNVLLVGPMGAGKSTIGKLLAARIHYHFCDTDSLIEERAGADIPWIFDVEGESGFRARESTVLAEVLEQSHTVIATGGGIVLDANNRTLIRRCPHVVYLMASVDQLVERTYKDRKRPLLQVDDPKKRIVELYEQRDPLYHEVASHILQTDGRSLKGVVQEIADLL